MDRTPQISVLVPCYNVEQYLRQCLDSISAQTFEDMEILCLNDGSTDSTPAIIREYADKDARFIMVDKSNSGYGATMNVGLEKARGKYIAIVESDDYIEPTMMEVLYREAEENRLDLVRCFYTIRNEVKGADKVVEYPFAELYDKVFCPLDEQRVFLIAPSIWVGLYNREFLDVNGIRFLETPGASYQDTSFAFKVYACAKRIKFVPKALHNYRINSNSSVTSPGKLFYVCTEDEEIRRFAKEKDVYEELKEVLSLRAYGSYKWNYNRLSSRSLKRQFIKRWAKDVSVQFKEGAITRRYFSKSRIFRLKVMSKCSLVYYFTRKF